MTRLHELFNDQGQSPWLDNLRRDWLRSGELSAWVDRGVRGVTSNPTIFEKAIGNSNDYDEQLQELVTAGADVETAYWELVKTDICDAVEQLAPVYEASDGLDGYVSVEVDPNLANDHEAMLAAAIALNESIPAPNLYIKIPGTEAGIAAIADATAAGISVNVTLLFSIERYRSVIDAYMTGLERHQGELSNISSVASFFISRVDSAVDAELDRIATPEALELKGTAAVDQAKVAYAMATEMFASPRWAALVERGARMQRPLWASTSTKNPDYPDTKYVDSLIGPASVNTIPDATLAAFEDHGAVARTLDVDVDASAIRLEQIQALGVDLDAIATKLESDGVASFAASFTNLLATLQSRVDELN